MSKIIKMTETIKEFLRKDFLEALDKLDSIEGDFSFSKKFDNEKKVDLIFSRGAFTKMSCLVQTWSKEIAWHGLVHRIESGFYVEDIIVYPQVVTGATVNTDQVPYQNWLYDLNDEDFNKVRMQGHSHVNMQTSPSGVDLDYYSKIIDQLDDDMFYIFLIWNKRNEYTVKIYDMQNNVLYENKDVNLSIEGIGEFLEDAKSKVKDFVSTDKKDEKEKDEKGTKPAIPDEDKPHDEKGIRKDLSCYWDDYRGYYHNW